MADENRSKYSNIKSELKENRASADTQKRSSSKASTSQYKKPSQSAHMQPTRSPHAYSNYDRETDITVELPKTLLSEIEKQKRAEGGAPKAPQAHPHSSGLHSNSPYYSEKGTNPPPKKKKAARSIADIGASAQAHEKPKVLVRATEVVNSKREKRRVESVRDKMAVRRKKSELRKKRALNRRKATLIGRFFLDEGERYTTKTVEGAQKITDAERMANRLSDFLYTNRIAVRLKKWTTFLKLCDARAAGVALIIFGLFSLLSYFVSAQLPMVPYTTDSGTLVCAILWIALSVPLLLSRVSLVAFFERSFIVSGVLFDFFGLRRSGDTKVKPAKARFGIILGVVLGLLGFLVSPVTVSVILLSAGLFVLVLSTPEFGLSLVIFLLPFLFVFEHPTIVLCAAIIICYISYLRKLALGKRSFRFRPSDLFVLLFGMFYLGGGIFSFATGSISYESALAYFCIISVYFLVSNLMTNKRTVDTVVRALVVSSFIVAVLGIIQGGTGYVVADWLDTSAYQYISGRVTSSFENPNVLASYLILVIPFALVYTFERGSFGGKNIFNALTLLCLIGALVLTWSRGAWVGICVGLLMLGMFLFRRSPKLVVAIFAGIPNLLLFAPESVWSRISSIFSFLGNSVDSSISYRLTVWRDSLHLFFDHALGGVGVGSAAFSEAYLEYASIGAESALHSHNLFLQIGIELGAFALILFLLVLVYTYRSCYSIEFAANQSRMRGVCLASFCSMTALLVNGMTDYVWYNYRICFLFWLVLGICNATYRIATEEQRYTDFVAARVSTFASVDVPYKK